MSNLFFDFESFLIESGWKTGMEVTSNGFELFYKDAKKLISIKNSLIFKLPDSECEDVESEIILKILESDVIKRYDLSTKFNTYITKYIEGYFKNYINRKYKKNLGNKSIYENIGNSEQTYCDVIKDKINLEDEIISTQTVVEFWDKIEDLNLSNKEKKLLILLSKDTETKIIAQELEIKEDNARKRIQLLRKKLKEKLNIL